MSIADKLKKLFGKKGGKKVEETSIDTGTGSKNFKKLLRHAIEADVEGDAYEEELSHFGGRPLLPPDFEWPYFETTSVDDPTSGVKSRPLAFIAQFDCEDIAAYDKDNLLPHTGVLSFFYSLDSNSFGTSPKDAGCARVYWFEDIDELEPAQLPADLIGKYRLQTQAIMLTDCESYPCIENLPKEYDEKAYDDFLDDNDEFMRDNWIRLLGWADIITDRMEPKCELISQGYDLSDGKIDPETMLDNPEECQNVWIPLLQIDVDLSENAENSGEDEDDLDDSECLHLFYWIKKEDLAERRFDKVLLLRDAE